MTMPTTSFEWLAIAINLGTAGVNFWLTRRLQKRFSNVVKLEAHYTQLIVEAAAAKYYTRRNPLRDAAKPLRH